MQNANNAPSTVYPGAQNTFRLDLQASRSDTKLYSLQQNSVGGGHNYGTLAFEFYYNGVLNTDNGRRKQMIDEIVLQKHWDDNKGQVSVRSRINEFGT